MNRRLPLRQPAAARFAVLDAVAVDRLHCWQETAQTVAKKQLIVSAQATLTFQMSQLTAARRRIDIATPGVENPIGWRYEKPTNYRWEYYFSDHENAALSEWKFGRREKTRVYLLTRCESFASNIIDIAQLQGKVFPCANYFPRDDAPASFDNIALVQAFDGRGVSGQ